MVVSYNNKKENLTLTLDIEELRNMMRSFSFCDLQFWYQFY